MKLVLGANMP